MTNQTPANILFRQELCLACDLVFETPDDGKYVKEIESCVKVLWEIITNIYNQTRNRIEIASDLNKGPCTTV